MSDKICFVLMGYAVKTDYRTGRQLDLDKTYEYLIKPVFDDMDITCIRASDVMHSGVIDVHMYEYIQKADIVVADLSTLNANAIYELGVRHALRPYTTIVIAEQELAYPFDLNHIKITSYEHLGKDIGITAARKFTIQLKEMVLSILENPAVDSPVYTFLKGLVPPEFTKQEMRQLKQAVQESTSMSTLLKEADDLKNENRFAEAVEKLEHARQLDPSNPYIIQTLALVTYKSKEPDTLTALTHAEMILKSLKPETTTDPATLGLLGAIYKRLYEEMDVEQYLQKSILYYLKGFIISRHYYSGMNLAYLYLLSASIATDEKERIADLINSKRVRAKTREFCTEIIESDSFFERKDKVWIFLTLSEIECLEGDMKEANRYLQNAIEQDAQDFEISSYEEQKTKILDVLKKLEA